MSFVATYTNEIEYVDEAFRSARNANGIVYALRQTRNGNKIFYFKFSPDAYAARKLAQNIEDVSPTSDQFVIDEVGGTRHWRRQLKRTVPSRRAFRAYPHAEARAQVATFAVRFHRIVSTDKNGRSRTGSLVQASREAQCTCSDLDIKQNRQTPACGIPR